MMRTMVNDLIIETNELTKSYGPHVALDKLSIQVQRGATGFLVRMEQANPPSSRPYSVLFRPLLGGQSPRS